MNEVSQSYIRDYIASFMNALKEGLSFGNIKLEKLYADLLVNGKEMRAIIGDDGSIELSEAQDQNKQENEHNSIHRFMHG